MMTTTHPLAALLPAFERQSYEELKEDIKRHGVKVPIIITPDHQIIDGRHRHQAATELGIDCPNVMTTPGQPVPELFSLILSTNLYRRHLKPDQISAWFARIRRDQPDLAKQFIDVDALKAQAQVAKDGNLKRGTARKDPGTPSGSVTKAVAAGLKVSESTVKRTEQVARKAPEALEAIERGDTSAKQVLKALPSEPKSKGATAPKKKTAEPLSRSRQVFLALTEVKSRLLVVKQIIPRTGIGKAHGVTGEQVDTLIKKVVWMVQQLSGEREGRA